MKKTILIIDDSDSMRLILKKILQLSDLPIATILEADSAEKGLAILQKEKVFLTFVDIRMPGMDGLDLVEQVNSEIPAEHRPGFIVISAMGLSEYQEKAKQLGVRGFIRKPFDHKELINTLHTILKTTEE